MRIKLSHLFKPADALMSRLSFAKKFSLLGTITLLAVGVALLSLYFQLNESIGVSKKELKGLALIQSITKNIQTLQQHRGLSSGVLSGINELGLMQTAKTQTVAESFNALENSLPVSVRQLDLWKNIVDEWRAIQASGMEWSQSKNFTAHTQLINKMLLIESRISDDYALTADPNLNTFYLISAAENDLLGAMEHLGQVRAYGTAILGKKQITEQQKSDMLVLVTLMQHSIVPLKINIDKAAHYNPDLRQVLTEVYANIETSSQQVIHEVNADILSARFSMQAADYFKFTTSAIDSGYAQLHNALIPAASKLIQARIQRTKNALYITIVLSGVFLLLVLYLMSAIHRTTLGSIRLLTRAVLDFVRGDMKGRVHLESHDELRKIGHGFNTMADELAAMIAERKATLDLLSKIAHSVPGVVYQFRQRVDGSSCFPFASEGIREIYRVSPEDVLDDASKAFSVTYPADLDKLVASIQVSAQDLTPWHHEYRIKFDEGNGKSTVKWLLGNAMPEREADGATLWHGFITDITARKAVESKLSLLSTAIEQSPASVVITDIDASIEYVNPRFTKVTGFTLEEAVGQNPRVLQSGLTDQSVHVALWDKLTQGKSWVGEFINRRKNGEAYYEEAYISPVKEDDGTVSHYVAVKLDITARKKLEEEVRQLAFYDTLTKLPNRRLLNDRLNQAITSSKRSKAYNALMFLDLDNFKPLNDTHGHEVGDMLLIEAANRLTGCIRGADTVARFGGDEFVVMLGELDENKVISTNQAAIVAEKIRAALSAPYQFTISHINQIDSTVEHRCTGSIGVIVFNGTEGNQDDMMKWADAAMYEAKDAGRNQIRFHQG